MKTIVLKISGLQSWGSSGKSSLRDTEDFPTLSGIVGLLQNICGVYEESDNKLWDKFSKLKIDVIVEKNGLKEKDYHTISGACNLKGSKKSKNQSTKLSDRYFLTDALFYVAIYGNDNLINFISEKIKCPENSDLFFGRRCFPANFDLFQGVFDGNPQNILLKFTKKDIVKMIIEYPENTLTTQILMDRPLRNRKFGPRKIHQIWINTIKENI